jgi:hypothetical protein
MSTWNFFLQQKIIAIDRPDDENFLVSLWMACHSFGYYSVVYDNIVLQNLHLLRICG